MSQMLFTHDTELTLRAASVLINSNRVDGEQMPDLAALDEYLDGFGWTGRRDHDDAELAAVHQLSLIHISEPTRLIIRSRMPSSA